MAQQVITIAATSKYPPRVYQGRTSYQVKSENNTEWCALYTDAPPNVGQIFTGEFKSNVGTNGKTYWNFYPLAQAQQTAPAPAPVSSMPAPPANGNGWPARENMLRTAPSPVLAQPAPVQPKAPATGPAMKEPLAWDDYVTLARAVHELAKELEPDDGTARAAILNTAIIAATNKNLGLPTVPMFDDDGRPPLDDSQFPA